MAQESNYCIVRALAPRGGLQRPSNAGKMLRARSAARSTGGVQVIGFDPLRRNRMLAGAFALALALAQPGLGHADEEAGRLKLRALIEEGSLILEEAHALQPRADQLAADGAGLDAQGTALQTESAGLNETILKFNATNIELQREVKMHQAECPPESEDKALVESCNARARELQPTVSAHEEQRPVLRQRQQALQQRIEAHNVARREWAAHKRDLEPRVQANRKDADYWLGEARAFLAGDGFLALAKKAGAPAACEPRTLGDLASPPASAAVQRAHACFQAVAGGLR